MNRSRPASPAPAPAPNMERVAALVSQAGAVVPLSAWSTYSAEVRRALVVGLLVGNGANPYLDRQEAAQVAAVVAALDRLAGVAPARSAATEFGDFVVGARVFVRWDATMRPAQIAGLGDNLVRLLVWTCGTGALPEQVDLVFSAFDEILDVDMGSWDGAYPPGVR